MLNVEWVEATVTVTTGVVVVKMWHIIVTGMGIGVGIGIEAYCISGTMRNATREDANTKMTSKSANKYGQK